MFLQKRRSCQNSTLGLYSFIVFVAFSAANQLLAIKQVWARKNNAAVQKLIVPVSITIYSIADISVKALQQKLFRLL